MFAIPPYSREPLYKCISLPGFRDTFSLHAAAQRHRDLMTLCEKEAEGREKTTEKNYSNVQICRVNGTLSKLLNHFPCSLGLHHNHHLQMPLISVWDSYNPHKRGVLSILLLKTTYIGSE